MKKLIIVSIFCSLIMVASSQDTTQMDISQIPNEVGVLYEKAFIDIGTINRVVEVKILEVKNLIENKVEKFIRVEFKTGGGYGTTARTYIAALNKDETESLITAMEKIISIVNGEKKFTYTEIVFKTYEGLIVGSFYQKDQDKWSFYIEKDKSVYSSFYPLRQEDFISLLNYIRSAFNSI